MDDPIVDTQAAILAAGISRRTLHRRVTAGLITPIGQDRRGRNLYRLDDVLAIVHPPTVDTPHTHATPTPPPR